MADTLPPETLAQLQSLAAEGRRDIERHLFPQRAQNLRTASLRSLGAIAIGLFAAGIAVFAVVIILNLVFHYAP